MQVETCASSSIVSSRTGIELGKLISDGRVGHLIIYDGHQQAIFNCELEWTGSRQTHKKQAVVQSVKEFGPVRKVLQPRCELIKTQHLLAVNRFKSFYSQTSWNRWPERASYMCSQEK